MAPISRVAPVPPELLKTTFSYIGLKDIHRHPEYDDIIDIPGEGEPGEDPGALQDGILIVIMVFGFVAVMFTIVAGYMWCVAADEPLYHSKRSGPWKTRKVIRFKEWYRRRNLPRTKSDTSHRSILRSLSAANWHGHVSRSYESDYSYKQWRRPKDTKLWREHGHLDFNPQFDPRSPLLFTDNRGQGYSTFSKVAGPEGAHILSMTIPAPQNMKELFPAVPYSVLTVPVPPLRRPPLKCAKGRIGSTPSRLMSVEDGDLRSYRPRGNPWSGCSSPRGRLWKCARRGPSDFDNSGRRPSWGSGGRGCSRGANRGNKLSVGLGIRGLDVVEEEALSGSEK